jgi:3-hydroxyisobutyrate dehydrogenase-like beta-hydroxyacid dehydrogenase
MALNLQRAGYEMIVFNRTADKAQPLIEDGAKLASSPEHAVSDCEILVTMLSNDQAVRETLLVKGSGRAAIDAMPKGAVHMSCSTTGVEFSKRLAQEHARRAHGYVVATVLGRPEAAADKKLWVITAGQSPMIERCRPLMEAIGRGITIVGSQPWQANLMKIAANFMLASCLESIGESFALVRKFGMDPDQFLEVVNSIFNSPVYANYGRIIADRQFDPAGFRLKLGLKDISLVLDAAQDVSAPMPVASLIRDHYLTAIARGRENQDWSAVAEIAGEEAGINAIASHT